MTRFDNVMSCACTARTRGDAPIPDAGALNYIKWETQSEVAGLSPALTKPNASGNMEPLRLAVAKLPPNTPWQWARSTKSTAMITCSIQGVPT